MAEKSVKKVSTKKVAVKKPAAKPVAAKKPVAKKPAVKRVAAKKPVADVVVAAPVVAEHHACGCDKSCACGGKCGCHRGGFFKKFILFLIIFALGFVAANICCDGKPGPKFDADGCLVIKCPKMAEMKPVMDVDANDCVSVEEFDAFRASRPVEPVPPVAE